jgi:hypothetical protein
MWSVSCAILTNMTACNVQKCTNAADETVAPLLIAGPLCDDHRTRLLAGEDWELQGTEESPIGMSQPTVLMDDSLRSLNQYVLLEPPNSIETGNPRHGDLVPLRLHRRGGPNETELTLVIPLLGTNRVDFSNSSRRQRTESR